MVRNRGGLHCQLKNQRQGFTVVELVIVIVVIAILAAIVFVAYNGIVQQAIEASMKSDLRSGSTLMEVSKTSKGVYPLDGSALLLARQ